MSKKPITQTRILVLCTGNRARSQMAEAWLRHFFQRHLNLHADIFSAGTAPKGVHPLAIELMADIGIDLSTHTSDHVSLYQDQPFDIAITVCDRAKEACPIFPHAKRTLHHSFDDPDRPDLSLDPHQNPEQAQQARAIFTRVRDDIRHWAQAFVENEFT